MDSLLLGSFKTPPLANGLNDLKKENLKKVCFSGSYVTYSSASRVGAWTLRERQCTARFQLSLSKNSLKGSGETSTFYQRQNKRFLVNAAAGHPLESEPEAYSPKNGWTSTKDALDAFYRFSRPHTVIGTALSIVSVSLLAVQRLSDFSPLFFTGVLEAVVAALFMNIYIVGLNQLYDIDIDKVNKPYLPLASGEYTIRTGTTIVTSFAVLSFCLSWFVGSWPLFWALFVSFILGTAYSINLPFLRWKRFAVVAAMCILAVRAVIVQLAFFLHVQTHVYKRPAVFSRPLIFATAFMSFFSVVIALFKDIPDIDGDRIYGIRSFTVRLGQKRVFWVCISLLEIAYCVALLVGASSGFLWSKVATVLGHTILASLLWSRAKSVDLSSKAAITSFYMFIWKVTNCLGLLNFSKRLRDIHETFDCVSWVKGPNAELLVVLFFNSFLASPVFCPHISSRSIATLKMFLMFEFFFGNKNLLLILQTRPLKIRNYNQFGHWKMTSPT